MKKAEISSTVFVYVVAIIVVSVIFLLGYKFILQSKGVLDDSEMLLLKNTIEQDITSVLQDFGSIKKRRYDAKEDLYLCFVDLRKKDEILQTELINFYPLMKDAITGGVASNVFVFTEKDLDSFRLKPIIVEQYPFFACFFPANQEISITYEGKGTQVNIQKNLLLNATLSDKRTTIVKSSDNMITIEIPSDANPSYPYLSIELIEHDDLIDDGKSDVYRITPSGITFQKPVTLRMHFTPSQECPKSLTYHQESEGRQLKTVSSAIDCNNNIVVFQVREFI